MIKLSGMWVHTNDDGSIRVTGNMGSCRLVMLPNKWKKSAKDSDYILYVAEPDKPSTVPLPVALPATSIATEGNGTDDKPVKILDDSDIPF